MSNISNSDCFYIKDGFVKGNKATISVQERGFRFGDGVFETIRVTGGQPYQWDLHLKRLQVGLKLLKIKFDTDIKSICDELLIKNSIQNGFLRISISRGLGSVGYLPDVTGGATLVVETTEGVPDAVEPVDLWLGSYKKIPEECLPSNAKTMQGLSSTLARMEAQENGCFEALLLSADGYICEGSSANIFWFKGGRLYTPASKILPGTIRDAVIRMSPYEVVQGDFRLDELTDADEVFLTNVAWLVAPVKALRPNGLEWDKFCVGEKIRDLLI